VSQYALELSGWEERSVWGWDPPVESYYAVLYRNTDADEDPAVWLHGVHEPLTCEASLAAAIRQATRARVADVLAAMWAGAPVNGRAAKSGQAFVDPTVDPPIFYEQDLELEADPDEQDILAQGYQCCWCYSVNCRDGAFGHIHRATLVPIDRAMFDEAARASWELPARLLRLPPRSQWGSWVGRGRQR
jgi:hypothetical protein